MMLLFVCGFFLFYFFIFFAFPHATQQTVVHKKLSHTLPEPHGAVLDDGMQCGSGYCGVNGLAMGLEDRLT